MIKTKLSILILIIITLFIIFPSSTTSAVTHISKPLFYLADSISNFANVIVGTMFSRKSSLISENDFLRLQNEKLTQQLAIANIESNIPTKLNGYIISPILIGPPHTRFDTYKISKGIEDEIGVGSDVYHPDGIIIGKVESVGDHIGTVILFSSPLVESSVSINKFITASKGLGGGGLYIEVPKEIEINEGDLIFQQGDESTAFARVSRVETVETEPTRKIYGNLLINLNQMKEFIIEPLVSDNEL